MTTPHSTSAATDTIYALSSGVGRAGVAVVRVSGPRAGRAAEAIAGRLPRPRVATVRRLQVPEGGEIDQALVLWLPAPASFTGEDTTELHVHGGRAVIEAVLAALGSIEGLRLAEPGEFTRRAFLNGKLDLTAAEGIADLIDAETEAQRRQAVRQASGALATLYEGWRHELIEAMACLEAALDFADEGDVPDDVTAPAWAIFVRLAAGIEDHLADGRRGEILRDGLHVVLAGPPNVGKSSLLNALAQRDVAIVSPEAGTTRDIIEVRLNLGGYPVVLTDTAGVREAHGAVEAEGIRRTLARAGAGDLVLWVTEAGDRPVPLPPEIAARSGDVRYVANKSDLMPPGYPRPPGPQPSFRSALPAEGGSCSSGRPGALLPPESRGLDGGGLHEDVRILDRAAAQPVREHREIEAKAVDPVVENGKGHAGRPLAVSAKTGMGMDQLVALLTEEAARRLGDLAAPLPTRARHRQGLERCRAALMAALEGDRAQLELRAEDARLAATALGRITGRVDVEDILDRIFAGFCIGK